MPITIVVTSGAREGESPPSITLDAPMIVLGRGEGCEVRLPDPSVSHRHATIRQRGSEYILQDEGSTNGTFIGDVRLGVQAPRILRHGEVVRLGRIFIEVRLDALLPTPKAPQTTKEIALNLVARALEAQGEEGGPRVVVVDGPDRGRVLFLDEPDRAYVVGRGRDADLVLDDADASRRHVQLVRRGDSLLVRDLGSKNGAELGGMLLPTDHDLFFRMGEGLRLGSTILVFEHPAALALAELDGLMDEAITEDENLEPPPSSSQPEVPVEAPPPSPSPPQEAAGDGPIAEYPPSAPAPLERAPRASGWTSADLFVLLLAIGVLGLSILGMYWLLDG